MNGLDRFSPSGEGSPGSEWDAIVWPQNRRTTPGDEERLVLATGRFIGEGFDDARLDTLFLALPISWKGTLVQYAGRLHRLHPDKTEVRIYDYVDRNVPVLSRMFERRIRGYRAIGYRTDDGDEDRDDGPGEIRIEWDENALRFLDEAYE